MIRALKSLARAALFGPRKRPMTFREKRDATSAKLRAELRADKLRAVQAELDRSRAVEHATKSTAALMEVHPDGGDSAREHKSRGPTSEAQPAGTQALPVDTIAFRAVEVALRGEAAE